MIREMATVLEPSFFDEIDWLASHRFSGLRSSFAGRSGARILVVWLLLSISEHLLMTQPSFASSFPTGSGVIVDSVNPTTPVARAGIVEGDRIIGWRSLGDASKGHHRIQDVWDWYRFRIDDADRGPIEIAIRRETEDVFVHVGPDVAKIGVRPTMSAAAVERSVQVLREGAADQKGLAPLRRDLEREDIDDSTFVWLLLEAATEAARAGDWNITSSLLGAAKESSEDPFVRGFVWRGEGLSLLRRGHVDEAENALEMAVGAWSLEFDVDSMALLRLDVDVSSILLARNELRPALDRVEEQLSRTRDIAPGSLLNALLENNLGVVQIKLGDFDASRAALYRALEIEERLAYGTASHMRTLINLGYLEKTNNHLSAAVSLYERALEVMTRFYPEHPSRTLLLNNYGAALRIRGDLQAADVIYHEALSRELKFAPESETAALIANNLGSLAQDRLEFDKAFELYSRSLEVRQRLNDESLAVAQSLGNLASLHIENGELPRALDLAKQALAMRQRLAPDAVDIAFGLHLLAWVHWKMGDLILAHDVASMCDAELDKHRGFAESLRLANLQLLGLIARDRGDLDAARAYWIESVAEYEGLGRLDRNAPQSYAFLSELAAARGDFPDAIGNLEKAVALFEEQLRISGGTSNTRSLIREEYGSYYESAIEAYSKVNRIAEAFEMSERGRARGFLELLAEREVLFTKELPEELDLERRQLAVRIDDAIRRSGVTSDAEISDPTSYGSLDELLAEQEALEEKIRRSSRKHAALRFPDTLGSDQVRAILDPGTLLLSFIFAEDRTLLFSVDAEGPLTLQPLEIRRSELRERIESFRVNVDKSRSPRSSWMSSLEEQARSLYLDLLSPVADRIAEAERLLILADGPLHYLPWGALVLETDGDQRKYLAELKPIHSALSATVYGELRRLRPDSSRLSPTWDLVAFGDPVYPGSREAAKRSSELAVRGAANRVGFDFSRLPQTRTEVEAIADLYEPDRIRVFLGEDATEDEATSLEGSIGAVHIAAHGEVDALFPMHSFLALTIPSEPDLGQLNGLLQVWEIFERLRFDADLVVLSACETALGDEQGGEGLIGLTRAFHYAGARSVASSLWRVDDRGTAELMTRFHRHLRAGKTKDESLRAAQVELINTTDDDARLAAPFYWAGFQLYGDWK